MILFNYKKHTSWVTQNLSTIGKFAELSSCSFPLRLWKLSTSRLWPWLHPIHTHWYQVEIPCFLDFRTGVQHADDHLSRSPSGSLGHVPIVFIHNWQTYPVDYPSSCSFSFLTASTSSTTPAISTSSNPRPSPCPLPQRSSPSLHHPSSPSQATPHPHLFLLLLLLFLYQYCLLLLPLLLFLFLRGNLFIYDFPVLQPQTLPFSSNNPQSLFLFSLYIFSVKGE